MKGLELCRLYYEQVGAPALKERFPEVMSRAAVGLSGQGSDCLVWTTSSRATTISVRASSSG